MRLGVVASGPVNTGKRYLHQRKKDLVKYVLADIKPALRTHERAYDGGVPALGLKHLTTDTAS